MYSGSRLQLGPPEVLLKRLECILIALGGLVDHLEGILAHLSGSPVAKLPKTRNYRSRVLSDVADIAEIDKDKKILAQSAKTKKRVGAGRPPQGSQSAATRRVGA